MSHRAAGDNDEFMSEFAAVPYGEFLDEPAQYNDKNMKTAIQLNKAIMRRVYYAFAIKLATHSVTRHVIALAIFGFLLKELVHVAAVYKTIASVQVGDLLPALARTIVHADAATLLVLGLCIFTALSLRFQIRMPQWRSVQMG